MTNGETSKTIDYSIDNVKNTNEDNFEITFERKGEMQMPIDFSVYANDGKSTNTIFQIIGL